MVMHKGKALEIKELGDDGSFSGYAARYGNVDHGYDVILPGAFGDFMKTTDASRIRVLWQHSWRDPIGVNLSWKEDDTGLLVEGKLLLGVQKANECQILAKAKAIGGLSIGYGIEKSSYTNAGVRVLERLTLDEYSFVTFPMNEEAIILDMKSQQLGTLKQCQEFLVDALGLPLGQAVELVTKIREAKPEQDVEGQNALDASLKQLMKTLETKNV